MPKNKQSVLIIEDDLDVAEMLNAYFRVQGYEVLTADWGEDGVQAAISGHPDIIILDIRLPDIDGFEVASRLRANRRTRHIPILFLTEKRQRVDRIKGLELGADDYITKPFDIQELRLRVRNALQRASQGPLTNPVTKLPEGAVVEERLAELLQEPAGRSLMIFRITNLARFRANYGFVTSDDALRAINVMIEGAVSDAGSEDDFLGHLYADDLLLITQAGNVAGLKSRISTDLTQSIDLFYPVSMREGGEPIPDRLDIEIGGLGPDEIRSAADTAALKDELVGTVA